MIDRHANFFGQRSPDRIKRLLLRQLHRSDTKRLNQLEAIERHYLDPNFPKRPLIVNLYVNGAPAIHEVGYRHICILGFRGPEPYNQLDIVNRCAFGAPMRELSSREIGRHGWPLPTLNGPSFI
ncbi:hypothetical protein [Pandoraea pnomenusa]|uniref:hypothetical protein n=1 Tax=Pandoraea pnomenusa TaxID=93220 RepID=UPI0012DA0D56|nr:hypothetical protein [Pandoraea pnomenusa]